MISGTSDSLLAPQLVDIIDKWKNRNGTFLVDLIRLRVRAYCPLRIKSFSEKECVDGGQNNSCSSPIGKCFDRCVRSECSQQDDAHESGGEE